MSARLRLVTSPPASRADRAARGAAGDDVFIGRDGELAWLAGAIAAANRAVWVTGPAGVGKTELLLQAASHCRDTGTPYYWLAPQLEPVTPSSLRTIADELARAPARRDRRRVLFVDDFALLRAIEPWFIEQFLAGLPPAVTVVVADRAPARARRPLDPRDGELALGPLGDADARRYLTWCGIPPARHGELVDHADGIPGLLACSARPRERADAHTRLLTRHDSDGHRLAIAVLVVARTTPYELLELAFDDAGAAREAFAWLSRLSIVSHPPGGLAPHAAVRRACERELADHAPELLVRARQAVRVFTDHRIAMARAPQRWVLDRLFVDRELAAIREHLTLPAGELALAIDEATAADRPALADLAAAAGRDAEAAIARWGRDHAARFDVLRGPAGEPRGYLCTVALAATEPSAAGDPLIDLAVARLHALGWFSAATPPDARALVFRDWTVAGSQRAPSPGAALLIAQMACRLLTTPAVDHCFVVTDQPARWSALARSLGLDPQPAGGHGDASLLAIDWRGRSVPALLQQATETSAEPPVVRSDRPARSAPPVAFSDMLGHRVAEIAHTARLSTREQEVLHLLLLGRNATEIGVALQITSRTARFHQRNVLEKIGAESRLDIVRLLL